MSSMRRNLAVVCILLAVVWPVPAAATFASIHRVPCSIITAVWEALRIVAPLIFGIIFLYGAAKYVYSAEDPGGRKQGKTILIHAIIGALIMGLLVAIVGILNIAGDLCGGMTVT